MSDIASLVRVSSLDRLSRLFPVGDQLIMPWKDMDDENHNTDETAYQVAWDIVHHGMVELRDGSRVPGLYIQMHKCSAYGVQFSNYQAFKVCPEGLAAGTYNVIFGGTFGSNDAVSGSQWQFTLTEAVPAGGLLSGFEEMHNKASSNWQVKSWASAVSASPIETVSVTAGSGGTNLGTMPLSQPASGGLNCMHRVGNGHNRWSTSAIRQYLNAAGTGWFSGKEDFDIRPNEYAKHGFMAGFSDDFLSAIKPVKVTTALNTAEGFTDATEDTYDTFFLPALQQMNATPQLANAEGETFDYWKQALGSQSFVGTGSANVFDAFKTASINNSAAQYLLLRSAVRIASYNTWFVNSIGYVSSSTATFAHRFTPVCVIC